MNIEMPHVVEAYNWDDATLCHPLLVKHNESGRIDTVILASGLVIYFGRDAIMIPDERWLRDNYTFIRRYGEGEKLIITC